MTKEELRAQRDWRVDTAFTLGQPDRVPIIPKVGGFYMHGYGISVYDCMMDARNMEPGIRQYVRDYEPDAVFIAGLYGIPIIETLDTQNVNWPGPTRGLPLTSSFQHVDGEYLHEDEFLEYIEDPTHVTLTKLLPRKHKNLAGLSKLNLREVFDASFFADLGAFTDPDVLQALQVLIDAGKAFKRRAGEMAKLTAAAIDEGYSTMTQGTFVMPFDAYADSFRGIIRTVMDTNEFPDELEQIVKKIHNMNVERTIKLFKSRGAKRLYIPLHCGVDEFISPDSYARFYWPYLKDCIMKTIDHGMTPVVFCEGNYNTRLDVISDVPKGKVVYQFEKVDIQKVKDTVGKVACVGGSLPTSLLAFGTPEQIEKETRRQIDILAPGGGFYMDCNMNIDNARHENLRVWHETTLKYGSY